MDPSAAFRSGRASAPNKVGSRLLAPALALSVLLNCLFAAQMLGPASPSVCSCDGAQSSSSPRANAARGDLARVTLQQGESSARADAAPATLRAENAAQGGLAPGMLGTGPWGQEAQQQLLRRAETAYQRHLGLRRQLVGSDSELVWPFPESANEAMVRMHPFLGTMEGCRNVFRKEYMVLPAYPCFEEERFGQWGEGGKWACWTSLRKAPEELVVYSFGSNKDSTFEESVHRVLGAKSQVFDPFVPLDVPAEQASYILFHGYGLAQGDEPMIQQQGTGKWAPAKSLEAIMGELGHRFIDLLKVDCEGCEAGFVDRLFNSTTRSQPLFGQLLLEIHNGDNFDITSPMLSKLHHLGFRLFHLEPNFFEPSKAMELAYIHESFVIPSNET